MRLKVGIRPSALALKQADEIMKKLGGGVRFDIVRIPTRGDKNKKTPLTEIEGTDFFTAEIELALLLGRIDVAVHSAKDLEEHIPGALYIAAMTASISPFDCLVSNHGYTLDTVPHGARIGTSSSNRQASLRRYRDDFILKDIRGTIEERVAQLDTGDFDAVVVAQAALIRLDYREKPAWTIPLDILRPHSLQGRLAVQIAEKRVDLIWVFEKLKDA